MSILHFEFCRISRYTSRLQNTYYHINWRLKIFKYDLKRATLVQYIYRKIPQFARTIFFSVSFASTCRSQTYPLLSSLIFCAGKYRHMTFIDLRRSFCKNANEGLAVLFAQILAHTRIQRQYHDKYEASYSGYCNLRVYMRIHMLFA